MINTMISSFPQITNNKTRLDMEIHYTKFIGIMPNYRFTYAWRI